jgi:hypothetical protein
VTSVSSKSLLRLQAAFSHEASVAGSIASLRDALSVEELSTVGADTLQDVVDRICGDDDGERLLLAMRLGSLYRAEVLDGLLR